MNDWKKIIFGSVLALYSLLAQAEDPVYEVRIQNHLFMPEVIEIPSATRVKLIVHNDDATPEEFESYPLNREKVIAGNSRIVLFIGPLEPGSYPFFGEFNPELAQGRIEVK